VCIFGCAHRRGGRCGRWSIDAASCGGELRGLPSAESLLLLLRLAGGGLEGQHGGRTQTLRMQTAQPDRLPVQLHVQLHARQRGVYAARGTHRARGAAILEREHAPFLCLRVAHAQLRALVREAFPPATKVHQRPLGDGGERGDMLGHAEWDTSTA
jgi:hypothetical protein